MRSRRHAIGAILAISMLLSSMSAFAAKKPAVTPQATVTFCTDTCITGTSASVGVNTTIDLKVFVSYSAYTGAHTQELRLYLPNGDFYQSLQTSFDTTTGKGLELTGINGLPTTATVIPVAGTWIQTRMITGTWAFDLYVDGKFIRRSNVIFY